MRLPIDDFRTVTAAESRPPATAPGGEVLRTLARVVAVRGRMAVERGLPLDGECDAGVRLACDAARQSGLQAEQLIPIIKTSWRGLASPRERHEFDVALDKLVSMCIAEFYRVREGSLKLAAIPNADRRGAGSDGSQTTPETSRQA